MDIRFDTWNMRRLYRAGSLMGVAKGLSNYKLDLARLKDVRWNQQANIHFSKKGE
jgi:hypothetical protein